MGQFFQGDKGRKIYLIIKAKKQRNTHWNKITNGYPYLEKARRPQETFGFQRTSAFVYNSKNIMQGCVQDWIFPRKSSLVWDHRIDNHVKMANMRVDWLVLFNRLTLVPSISTTTWRNTSLTEVLTELTTSTLRKPGRRLSSPLELSLLLLTPKISW